MCKDPFQVVVGTRISRNLLRAFQFAAQLSAAVEGNFIFLFGSLGSKSKQFSETFV